MHSYVTNTQFIPETSCIVLLHAQFILETTCIVLLYLHRCTKDTVNRHE